MAEHDREGNAASLDGRAAVVNKHTKHIVIGIRSVAHERRGIISRLSYSKFTFTRPSKLIDETKRGEVCTDDVVGTSKGNNEKQVCKGYT